MKAQSEKAREVGVALSERQFGNKLSRQRRNEARFWVRRNDETEARCGRWFSCRLDSPLKAEIPAGAFANRVAIPGPSPSFPLKGKYQK
jgi:hypothetical protein